MCLAVPGKILEIDYEAPMKMAKVSFEGITKEVCVEWIETPNIGEYVVVHAGFAINKMDEKEAEESLKLFREIADKIDEDGIETYLR